jgi:hypothetical protein
LVGAAADKSETVPGSGVSTVPVLSLPEHTMNAGTTSINPTVRITLLAREVIYDNIGGCLPLLEF